MSSKIRGVQGVADVWRYGFGGNGLDTNYFETLQTGTGQTVRVGTIKREGTWTRSTTTATATVTSHGLVTGDLITIMYTPDELAIIYGTVSVTNTGTDTFTFTCLNAGVASGVFTYGQDISNLQLLSGVTPNSETVLKSKISFTGTMDFTFGLHMNQRIANTELIVGLFEVDAQVDGVSCSITSTTATATKLSHGLQQGQDIQIISSDDGSIKTTSVKIISVPSVDTFTFTCVGGVGATATISYFSYDSAIQIRYDGTSATTARVSTFRNVWDSPAPVTINTTAGAPNSYRFQLKRGNITYGDFSPNNTSGSSVRAERNKEVPSLDGNFFIFIRLKNLAVAPASNTTCTFAYFEVNQNGAMPVEMTTNGMASYSSLTPVQVLTMPSSIAVAGTAATSANVSGNPVYVGAKASTSVDTSVANGEAVGLTAGIGGQLIVKPYSVPENEFAVNDSINNSTTPVQIRVGTATHHTLVNNLSIQHGALSGTTVFEIRTTPVASTTATIATNTLVMAATYGWKVGDKVKCTAISGSVTGMSVGNYYYILTVSSASLTFSTTRGGATMTLTGSSVNITLSKILFSTELGTAALPLINLILPCPSSGIALSIEAITNTAVAGNIYFNVGGYISI